MEILTVDRPMTWPDRLRALKVNKTIKVDIKNSYSVRSSISRMKYTDPEYEFKTRKKEEDDIVFIQVERLK